MQQLRFAIVQSHFLAGDVIKNAQIAHDALVQARQNNAQVVIFPELMLMGSEADDLVYDDDIYARTKQAIARIAKAFSDLVVIIGYVHKDHNGVFNSAAILAGGAQKGFCHKQNFDKQSWQARFCEGSHYVVFEYQNTRLALAIGDDIKDSAALAAFKRQNSDIIINIDNSAFMVFNEHVKFDASKAHMQTLLNAVKQTNAHLIYCNSVGGGQNKVFEGASLVMDKSTQVLAGAPRFLNKILFADFDINKKTLQSADGVANNLSDSSKLYQALVVGLRDYVRQNGFKGVIVGLSGGIDSALSLCIATDALGASNVYAVMMPYTYTSQISIDDAKTQAERLGVSYTVCPIYEIVDGIKSTLSPLFSQNSTPDTTEENIQARARGVVLMALSNKFGHMVVNTTNKSEACVGYGTLYGDLVGGYAPLIDVYKTQVYELARYRNQLEDTDVIPYRVINRAPSAELSPDQKDSDSLPDYAILDRILAQIIENEQPYTKLATQDFDKDTLQRVFHLLYQNQYKRAQAPKGTCISQKSLQEFKIPLSNHYRVGDE